jgi:hypothetical protein
MDWYNVAKTTAQAVYLTGGEAPSGAGDWQGVDRENDRSFLVYGNHAAGSTAEERDDAAQGLARLLIGYGCDVLGHAQYPEQPAGGRATQALIFRSSSAATVGNDRTVGSHYMWVAACPEPRDGGPLVPRRSHARAPAATDLRTAGRSERFVTRVAFYRELLGSLFVNPLEEALKPMDPAGRNLHEIAQDVLRMSAIQLAERARDLAVQPGFQPFWRILDLSAVERASSPGDLVSTYVTFAVWGVTDVPPGEHEALIEYLLDINSKLDPVTRDIMNAIREARRVLIRVLDTRNGAAHVEEIGTHERWRVQMTNAYPLETGQIVLATIVALMPNEPRMIVGRAWRIARAHHDAWLAEAAARSTSEGLTPGRDRYRRWIDRGDDALYWRRVYEAHGPRVGGSVWLVDVLGPPDRKTSIS